MNKNNKTNTIIAIFLCLPIILIAILFVKYYNHNNTTSSISEIRISIPDGETITLSGDNTKFYTEVYHHCQKIDSPPRDIHEDEKALTVIYVIDDITTHYDLYFSDGYKTAFFITENNDYFLLNNEHASLLSLRPECIYIYKNNSIPCLFLNRDNELTEIFPVQYNWRYRKSDNKEYDNRSHKLQEDDNNILIIHSSSVNKVSFDVAPDKVTINFLDELGNVFKTVNSLEELSVDTKTDKHFSLSIYAEWTTTENAYGNARYNVKLLYDTPEKFTLSNSTVHPGDMLIIFAEQFDLNEEVTVETDLKNLNLKFVKERDKTFAFVPIDSTNVSKEYYIKLTVNENETVLKFFVEHIDFGVDFYNPSKVLSENANQNLQELYDTLNADNQPIKHFKIDEGFQVPLNGEIFFNYGKEIFASSGPASYFVQGNEYKVDSGTKVKSAECGVVVFVGEDERLGNLVVIDHGLGIKTYYAHLDSINVEIGDLVQKNITIATSGSSGYTDDTMFYFAVSVNGTFINPQTILDKGITIQ